MDVGAAHRAAAKLVEQSDHLLCANAREKHRMLQLLEKVRKADDDIDERCAEITKDAERVVVDTILPAFRAGDGYRAFLEELFPPIKPQEAVVEDVGFERRASRASREF